MDKKFYSVLFIFFSLLLFSLEIQHGFTENSQHSLELFLSFQERGLAPEIQLRKASLSTRFPFDILFLYTGKNSAAKTNAVNDALLILISQQDAEKLFDPLCTFLSQLAEFPPAVNITVVCCAEVSANPDAPEKGDKMIPLGLEEYLSIIEKPAAAFVIQTAPAQFLDMVHVIPGGAKTVAPLPLVKHCFSAMSKARIPFTIAGKSMSSYRLGIIDSDPKLNFLLDLDIPSIGFSLVPEKNDTAFFKALSDSICKDSAAADLHNLKKTTENGWDRQYSIVSFPFFQYHVYFSEYFFVVLLIALSGLALFFLCFFSFSAADTSKKIADLKRTWFLPPALIALNILLLFAAQKITIKTIGSYTVMLEASFLFKLMLAAAFLQLISFLQYLFKLPVSFFIYGYLLQVIAFINIFLFAAMDISLVPYFAVEYIIIYLSRTFRRTGLLFAAVIFMAIPFIPFINTVAHNCAPSVLRLLTDSSNFINFLLTMLLTPFQIMWIRILIQLGLFGRSQIPGRNFILLQFCLSAAAIGVLAGGLLFLKNAGNASQMSGFVQEQDENHITLSAKCLNKFFQDEITCSIQASLPVIKYRVTVISDETMPVYNANYPYSLQESMHSAVFSYNGFENSAVQPEMPELIFSVPAHSNPDIFVTAWLDTNGTVLKEQAAVSVKTEDSLSIRK